MFKRAFEPHFFVPVLIVIVLATVLGVTGWLTNAVNGLKSKVTGQ